MKKITQQSILLILTIFGSQLVFASPALAAGEFYEPYSAGGSFYEPYSNGGNFYDSYSSYGDSYQPDVFDSIDSYSNWYDLEDEGVYSRDLVYPYDSVYGVGGTSYGSDYYYDDYDYYPRSYYGGGGNYSYSAAYGYGGSSPYTQPPTAKPKKTTTAKNPAKKAVTKAKPSAKAQPTVNYVEPTPYITREKPSTESLVASVTPVVQAPVQQVVSYVRTAEYYPVPVQPQLNYVALTQIPYTGYDFGKFGNVFAWAAFLALIASAAYLAYYLATYLRLNFRWENPFRLY